MLSYISTNRIFAAVVANISFVAALFCIPVEVQGRLQSETQNPAEAVEQTKQTEQVEQASPVEPVEHEELVRLIEQLKSNEFSTRESAQEKLIAIGRPALPAMQQALAEQEHPELQRRLKSIVDQVLTLKWHSSVDKALEQAKQQGKMVFVFSTIGAADGFL